jgi:hypothetical protein
MARGRYFYDGVGTILPDRGLIVWLKSGVPLRPVLAVGVTTSATAPTAAS